jgi:PAS domain S-box-containing protein
MLLEERFRELLEAAPDAIMQVDADGRIILLNRVTEDMFGYSRDELLGQPVEVLIPPEIHARHAEHRAQYRQHPMTRTMGSGLALEGIRKDGSRFPIEISLSPSASAEGFRVIAIIRDTTERRAAEDRLRRVREDYTRRLAETNAELEMTNRELERANRLKSEFLASMSHELRTPLHTIIGFSELLAEELEGPLNEKQHRFVQHIHKDSLHLLELINDVLDISKIEADRLELRPEAFDFTALVAESLASIRSLAEAKSHTLETALDIPAAVEADRLRIKQILVNLLSNAVKFTPEGGRIRVEARVQETFVVVSVSDTGIGIPPEEHEFIFDKFHQVGATTKGVREGTGLGLAITKRLVEQHGGRIWVQSQPQQGSTFLFTLPLRSAERKTQGA